MEKLVARLEQECHSKGIDRFSAEEIVELLEDGETIEWILGEVVQEGARKEVGELTDILAAIAAEVAPPPPEEEEEEETEPVATEGQEDSPDKAEEIDWNQLSEMDLPAGVDRSQIEDLIKSPQGALLNDFGAFCEEKGVDPEGKQDEMSEAVQELHEEWLQTPRPSLEGKKPSEVLEGGRLFPQKVETFRREAPKVGRNDPCPCGSGKKYKKCCGKAA